KDNTPERKIEVTKTPETINKILSSSPLLIWEEAKGQTRLYLKTKYEDQDAIRNTAKSIFGENYRGVYVDYDKDPGRWYIIKPETEYDLTPFSPWIK
ncbi:MAG: hypothetical protein LBI95_03380, partial [Holosporales bacterium]|nr:hypothetical protein [Holosporales bacterium]